MKFLSLLLLLEGFPRADCNLIHRSLPENFENKRNFRENENVNASESISSQDNLHYNAANENKTGFFENDEATVFEEKENDCPDKDLQSECDSICRLEYNRCRLLCESDYCQSICDREYQNCRDNCPCGANCKEGCFNCDNDICQTTTIIFEKTTAATFEKHILVMGSDLSEAFSISLDGSKKTQAAIAAPKDGYAAGAPHALLKGELYIFGGYSDRQKIAKLTGCELKEESTRLINRFSYDSAALSIDNNVLICFDSDEEKRCEIFDGKYSILTHSARYRHLGGKLGLYMGQPTTVGYFGEYDANRKVETLSASGWISLRDFPSYFTDFIGYHVLVGLPSGSLLLAGGWKYNYGGLITEKAIWLLQDDIWNQIGNLKNADFLGSAIMIDKSIFVVSGSDSPHAIERLDFEKDELISQEVIGNSVLSFIPVLFEISANDCV